MKTENFNTLYVMSFKEQIAGDVADLREKGATPDQVTGWLESTYGQDLARLTPEGMNEIATSLNQEGWKYLFRRRNRMSLPQFQKEVENL